MSHRAIAIFGLLLAILGAGYLLFSGTPREAPAPSTPSAGSTDAARAPKAPGASTSAAGTPSTRPSSAAPVAGPTGDAAPGTTRVAVAGGGAILGRAVTPEGTPVPDATVRVGRDAVLEGDPAPRIVEGAPSITWLEGEVRAGTDGAFRIPGLEPGLPYSLLAAASGRRSTMATDIEVRPGVETEEVRLALPPAFAISGKVLDSEKRPIPDARVRATTTDPAELARTGPEGPHLPPEVAETTAGGEFRLPDLGETAYDLEASAEGYAAAKRIGVRAGAEGIEILLARSGRIVGRVVDPSERPVTRFAVVDRRDLRSYEIAEPRRKEFEDPQGRFALEQCEEGLHDLTVEARGFAATVVEDIALDPKAEAREILVRMRRGGRVVGSVRLADGTAVGGARVTSALDAPTLPFGETWDELPARSARTPDLPEYFRTSVVVTREDGSFALESLRPGSHDLLVRAPGRGSVTVPGVEIVEGGTAGPLEIVLPIGGAIAGSVTDAAGAPVDGAAVIAFPPESTGRAGTTRWRFAMTKGGEYRIEDLAPGVYMLIRATEDVGGTNPPHMQTAQVRSGETTRVDFADAPKGATLVGRVEDPDGAAIPGAQVVLFHFGKVGSAMKSGFADREGNYRIVELPPGMYGIYLGRGASFTSVFLDVVTIPDSPTEVRHDVTVPSGIIAGRVTDARTGKGLAGARLTLLTGLGVGPEFPGGFTVADEKGEYRFRDLAPRNYRISATATGYGQEASERFSLPSEGERTGVDLALEAGGSLHLVALDAAGGSLTGAIVTFRDDRGETTAVGIVAPWLDANSAVSSDGVKPGRYTAIVLKDGGIAAMGPFEVRSGERTVTTIRGVPAGAAPARAIPPDPPR
ncbi:MAG: carboxypeptidase regulatory-like domain-containing protein [Planctomycetes bacterium]|nr:carboxypeptidase regulatory-like domain-containing protein [Planctomycetota bacterium]